MPARGPLSREEFLREMEIEAKKLERFARELREGKWDTFDIGESFSDGGRGSVQENATIVIRATRLQAYGTGRTVKPKNVAIVYQSITMATMAANGYNW